jgi:hypothetical protein
MGHVANNIGGIYEHYKTAGEEGVVYTAVPKDHQKKAMVFLQKNLFSTPDWLIDKDIFDRIEYSGSVDRIRAIQARSLNTVLSLGKMQRLTEAHTYDSNAYSLPDMMKDLRQGIWSELRTGKKIDTYRRNLQRAHIDRLAYLMTAENQSGRSPSPYVKMTAVNTSQSDIRAVVRAELKSLRSQLRSARGGDAMSRIHIADAIERINNILDPKFVVSSKN